MAPTIDDIAVPVVPSTRGGRSGHTFCSVRSMTKPKNVNSYRNGKQHLLSVCDRARAGCKTRSRKWEAVEEVWLGW